MNERLAKIRIWAKFHNINLICAHSQTEEKGDAVKDAFYANLVDLYHKCPVHEIKIFLGYFNAKVGQEVIFRPTTTSHNGVRLIDFAAARNMVICSTRFQHLDMHKVRSTRNQIDHVVIDGRYASNVPDVRRFRCPNMYSNSFLSQPRCECV